MLSGLLDKALLERNSRSRSASLCHVARVPVARAGGDLFLVFFLSESRMLGNRCCSEAEGDRFSARGS